MTVDCRAQGNNDYLAEVCGQFYPQKDTEKLSNRQDAGDPLFSPEQLPTPSSLRRVPGSV